MNPFLLPFLALCSSMVALFLNHFAANTSVGNALLIVFALTCPGWSLVRLLKLRSRTQELGLSVVLSVVLTCLIALVMVYAKRWSWNIGIFILAEITVLGAGLQMANIGWSRARKQLHSSLNPGLRKPAPPKRFRWKLVSNASYVIGSAIITSGLGFVFWWGAARLYPTSTIGLASAATSAMLLLGGISTLGLGTLLLGELGRAKLRTSEMVSSALGISSAVGVGLGALFALIAPYLSAEFAPIGDPAAALLFAVGVGLTTATMVLDEALIGLLRAELHLWRNGLSAVTKVLGLVVAGLIVRQPLDGMGLFLIWVVGQFVSLAGLMLYLAARGVLRFITPNLRAFHGQRTVTLQHHAINLALQGTSNVLPILVAGSFSAEQNAGFYVAWMIAAFGFFPSHALASVLYAMTSATPSALAARLRLTLGLSTLVALVYIGMVYLGAHLMLGLFGKHYAENAEDSLKLLVLAALPMVLKVHYVAVGRLKNRIVPVAIVSFAGVALELSLAFLGSRWAGLPGLCLGFVIALSIEALLVAYSVFSTAFTANGQRKDEALADPVLGFQTELGEAQSSTPTPPQTSPLKLEPKAPETPALGSVCAVVITYNRARMLATCLEAIHNQTRLPDLTIVVDNGSNPEESALVARHCQRFPRMRHVFLPDNTGPAGGFSHGIGLAHQLGFDWAWILDDDVFADPDALEGLIEVLAAIPTNKQPNILTGEASDTNGQPHPVTRPVFGLRWWNKHRYKHREGPMPIRAASFVNTLLKLEAVSQHGLPVKQYFVWNDDLEYTARLLRDRPGLYVPTSHSVHASTAPKLGKGINQRFYFEIRNKLWMIRHSSAWTPIERLGWVAFLVLSVSRFLMANSFSAQSRRIAYHGLRDGLHPDPFAPQTRSQWTGQPRLS